MPALAAPTVLRVENQWDPVDVKISEIEQASSSFPSRKLLYLLYILIAYRLYRRDPSNRLAAIVWPAALLRRIFSYLIFRS